MIEDLTPRVSPFHPPLPRAGGAPFEWGRLYGSGAGLAIAGAARDHEGPVIVLTPGMPATERLEHELRFYLAPSDPPVLILPDRETLPYDAFSPHQDIVSERLDTLQRLPSLGKGVLLAPVGDAIVVGVLVPVIAAVAIAVPPVGIGPEALLAAVGEQVPVGILETVMNPISVGVLVARVGPRAIDLEPVGQPIPVRILLAVRDTIPVGVPPGRVGPAPADLQEVGHAVPVGVLVAVLDAVVIGVGVLGVQPEVRLDGVRQSVIIGVLVLLGEGATGRSRRQRVGGSDRAERGLPGTHGHRRTGHGRRAQGRDGARRRHREREGEERVQGRALAGTHGLAFLDRRDRADATTSGRPPPRLVHQA